MSARLEPQDYEDPAGVAKILTENLMRCTMTL